VKTLASILLLFTIISVISISPSAFADTTITTSDDSGYNLECGADCYTPSTVTVDVGEKVIFSNPVGFHTFTAGTWESGMPSGTTSGEFDVTLQAEGTAEWIPETAGEVPYYCTLHSWMKGTITVQEAVAEEVMEETMDEMTPIETIMIGDVDVTMSPPIMGSDDATVTIIEFGDYQCPKCDQWFQNEKPTITADYIDTDKAKLYFVDFPFLGQDSDNAANASYCANDQGKFWEYHSTLYNNQGGINEGWASVDTLKQFGADLGLDTAEFNACVDSNKHADRVSYNKQVGTDQGVEGTPVFIIVSSDGTTERIDGPQSSAIFADVIDSMLGEVMVEPVMAMTLGSDEMMAEIMTSNGVANEEMSIDLTLTDLEGNGVEHITYNIMATQGDDVLLDEEGHMHKGTITNNHVTSALSVDASDTMPVVITVETVGFGHDDSYVEASGEITTKQVVPEFGTIAMMILLVAIISIVAVTAKSRLSIMPRI